MIGVDIDRDSSCFVDTNIWLYAFIRTSNEEKFVTAQNIIAGNDIIISTQIINEMSVNLLKKTAFTEQRLQSLISSIYKKYSVLELSQDILIQASQIRSRFAFSFWDSIVAATAMESEADFLISEDMQHGFKFADNLTIVNPFLQ